MGFAGVLALRAGTVTPGLMAAAGGLPAGAVPAGAVPAVSLQQAPAGGMAAINPAAMAAAGVGRKLVRASLYR